MRCLIRQPDGSVRSVRAEELAPLESYQEPEPEFHVETLQTSSGPFHALYEGDRLLIESCRPREFAHELQHLGLEDEVP